MNTADEDIIIPKSIEELSQQSKLDEFTQKKLLEEEKIIHKEHEKKLEGIKKNTLIFGGAGLLIIILSLGLYIVPTFFEFQEVRANITTLNQEIDELEIEKLTNKKTLEDLYIEQTELEEKFGETFPLVLPEVHSDSEYQSSINRIAMFFEEFALHPGAGYSPLELPSISFGKAKQGDGVFIIPIKMTIESDRKSFNFFIKNINDNSGSLDSNDFYYSKFTKKKEPIPIMSIDSLNISLPKQEKSSLKFLTSKITKKKKNTLSFSVSLSAYFKSTEYMEQEFGSKKKKK